MTEQGAVDPRTGKPSSPEAMSLWQAAFDGLGERDLEPLAAYLEAGLPVCGVLADELAEVIRDAASTKVMPRTDKGPSLAARIGRLEQRMKVGAYVELIKLLIGERGSYKQALHAAAVRFNVTEPFAKAAHGEFCRNVERPLHDADHPTEAGCGYRFEASRGWTRATNAWCADNGIDPIDFRNDPERILEKFRQKVGR